MAKVKICGITNLEDALIAQNYGADFVGFIFADSPRRIDPKKAGDIIAQLSPSVKIVALFVNEAKEKVLEVVDKLGRVDLLQFHGDETSEYCRYFIGKKEIIKAFRIKDEASIAPIKAFGNIDFVLLDTFKQGQYGGTGKGFDLCLAFKVKQFNTPIFLSGGLKPDNVKEALEKVRPFCVDVSSGVEKEPGKKDAELVKRFIQNVKLVY
jgi:phosphoribosylanthranilate isomerase